MYKFRSIALILISIVKESIAHADLANLVFGINMVLQLFEPHPVIRVLSAHDVILSQLFDHINIMNDIQN